jgi:predicted dehydrogenase
MSSSYFDFRASEPRPIVILGAGGIVKDAHLPAYARAGYTVHGIYNRTLARAQALAEDFGIKHVWGSLETAVEEAPSGCVFDLALMPEQFEEALTLVPEGSAVLIQKPMGHDLGHAQRIARICHDRHLTAAVNTQLRFAGFVREARAAIERGTLGEVFDMEVRVVVNTPWELFPNVMHHARLEIAQHSVHYLDLVRSFFGTPASVCAVTTRHPTKGLAATRSTILMSYHDALRVTISTNHDHDYGPEEQESFIKWEGTEGAVKARFGLLMDYPKGRGDHYREVFGTGETSAWTDRPNVGTWFPDAFMGSMGALMRYLAGDDPTLSTSVDDVLETMACVEAAYQSNGRCGVDPMSLITQSAPGGAIRSPA